MNDRYDRRNASGCLDPTAYEAIRNVDKSDRRNGEFHQLLHTIFYLCELADFRVDGRISLTDNQTGKTWK